MKSEAEIQHMQMLFRQGCSKRRIAAELGISRNTLERYLKADPSPPKESVANKKKLYICLEWLNKQQLTGKEDRQKLWQRAQEDMQVMISYRTLLRAIQKWKQASHHHPERLSSNGLVKTDWRIGPYHFTTSGELTLRGVRIEISRAQRDLLVLFVRHPNQLISYEEIAKHLWPQQKLGPNWRRNVSLTIHRLRQVFAMGPLGGQIFQSVYQCGYVLNADVDASHPPSLQRQVAQRHSSTMQTENPFYGEAHSYWANRDPYKLPRQEYLLQRSIRLDPMFAEGYLELCYFQLLQCVWGMRAAQSVRQDLQEMLETIDELRLKPAGLLGIKAEVQSLLLWQPLTTQRLYGAWLTETLPRGMPLFAWARHLIFTGKAETALSLIKANINKELCQGWLILAMAHLAIGDCNAAENAIQTQLSLDSTMVGTRLFLALLLARRGQSAQATTHVLKTGILDRPFQGVQALAAYSLARGSLQQRAHQLLNEALERVQHRPSHEGALAYWGLAALALDRPTDAIHLLKLSVDKHCYSAPVLYSTPLLKIYAHSPACRLFAHKMRKSFPVRA
ncbi:MAG: winged helix-turn-helix domain-containing protein [Cyanobacteriota bacterium]